MAADPLRVPVAELVGRPGASRAVVGCFDVGELALEQTGSQAAPEVTLDLTVETIVGGLSVTGTITADWSAPCRRCLTEVTDRVAVGVEEIFEDRPAEAETWPIEDEHIDLRPLVREAVLLSLPLAPLCGDACEGPDPGRFPATARSTVGDGDTPIDPRWAPLDQLRFD